MIQVVTSRRVGDASARRAAIRFLSTVSCEPLRGPTPDDVKHFRAMMGNRESSILTTMCGGDENDLDPYNIDWTRRFRGSSRLVLSPRCTREVSSILKYCNQALIGVVTQGGNTGLCGGATPVGDELILSLKKMDSIYGIDETSGILTCDSGAIIQNLQDYAESRKVLFPLDIGSKGTCLIGGCVGTNAGGQYYSRFGSLHSTVRGLEAVLADGQVLHLNMQVDDNGAVGGVNLKDNTGYDLKHLFIGSEGTLGVITKVAIECPPLPSSKHAAMLVCDGYADVLRVVKEARNELGEVLSALEVMDLNTMSCVKRAFVNSGRESQLLDEIVDGSGQASQQPIFLLIEAQGSNEEHDASKMDTFLTNLFETGSIQNGFLAQDTKQLQEMWELREACNPSVASTGYVYKFDVSIPVPFFFDTAQEVESKLVENGIEGVTVCVWGHLGDGNAHINIVKANSFDKDIDLAKIAESVVFQSVLKRKGSISAEHGLGQTKNEYLRDIKSDAELEIMRQLKSLFDPHGIMNPMKYLPR